MNTVNRRLAKAILARVLCLVTTALVGGSFLANAQERSQARSMVISKGGIVASESPLASQAGVHISKVGGNAVDAAIATNAMMGVVEPMMNGSAATCSRSSTTQTEQALRAERQRAGRPRG